MNVQPDFVGVTQNADPASLAVLCGDLSMLRCFERAGVPTTVVAWNPREVTLRSRLCRSSAIIAPPTDERAALEDLCRLGRLFTRRPVLYYGTDDLLLLISRNRERLSPFYRFRMPPAELIQDLVDKGRFWELAEKTGLKVPPTIVVRGATGFDELKNRVPVPCVFKPVTHIGWFKADVARDGKPRKALRAEDMADAERLFSLLSEHRQPFIIQSYVPGGEERIYSYHAYVTDGGFRAEFAGKKIRTYPMEAGVSTYLELVREPRVIEAGREVAEKLGLVGPMKLDFKSDPRTGELFLLEVNPRFSLWNYLGAVSGVNLPLLCLADLLGEPLPKCDGYVTGVRWLSFANDFRAFYRDYRLRGPLTWSQWIASFKGPKVYDVFAWNDPVPFLSAAISYAGALLGRRVLRPLIPGADREGTSTHALPAPRSDAAKVG